MTIAKNHSGVVYSAIPLNGDAESTTIVAASNSGIRVQVEAPASLAEGFSFLASYQGRMFSVTVVRVRSSESCIVLEYVRGYYSNLKTSVVLVACE